MKINGHNRFIEDKKKSNVFDNNWEPKVSVSVTVSVDPCDMLKNFCFHVYAQKSWFIAENCNALFGTSPSPVSLDVIELVPS